MLAQRNFVYLAILAAIGLLTSAAMAADKPAPTTQPADPQPAASTPASAQLPGAPTTAPAETTAKEIPLEKVWAYQMPGTRPLEMPLAADGKTFATNDGKSLSEILLGLKDYGSDVRGGFVVMGVSSAALAEAHKILVDNQGPSSTLDRNQKLSVVFFSHQSGLYVHLKKIMQKGSLVEISYQFVARDTKDFTPQIAIIPLYDVPAGTLKIVLRSEEAPAPATPVDPREFAGEAPSSIVTLSATPE